MVQSSSITALIINIVICFGMPLGSLAYLLIKKKRAMIPFFAGMATFIVFQLMLRVPLVNGLFASMDWYKHMTNNPLLYGLFLGLMAGLVEEGGRYCGYRALLKERDRWIDGFALGAGYGGIGAVVVGITYLSNLALILSINNGDFAQLTANLSADEANQIFTQLTALQPFDILLSGLERIFAFIIQIALSLLVLISVRKKKVLYLGAAVLTHFLVDTVMYILQYVLGFSMVLMIIYLGLMTAIAIVFMIRSRKAFEPIMPLSPSAAAQTQA